MQIKETIEKYEAEIRELQKRGEHGKSHACAKVLLTLCNRLDVDPAARCRSFILAARSAYFVSRFDEALSYLASAEALAAAPEISSKSSLLFESAIVKANILRRQARLREALAALKPFGEAAVPGDSPTLLAEKLLIEGACHFYLNELRRAEEHLETALGLSIHYADARVRSRVLIMLGLIAQTKGRHEAALEYFERARELCGADSDYYGEAAAALNAGILLYRRGCFAGAERAIERARAIFEKIEWRLGVCRALLALGNVSRCRGDYPEAIRSYREADRIAEERGYPRERALASEFIGDAHKEHGRHQSAERRYREALARGEAIAPEGDLVVEINRRLGELQLLRSDVPGALVFLRKGLRLSQRLGDRLEKGAILGCMGRAAFLLGDLERGIALFAKAFGALKDAGCDFELGRTHLALVELLTGDGGSGKSEPVPAAEYSDEILERVWASAVEAGHLFGGMDAESWKASAQRGIDRMIALRGKRRRPDPVLREGRSIVKIAHSPACSRHDGFVAVSAPMLALWDQIQFAAKFDRPILVTGETGTGKELVARLIHLRSGRSRRPFVALNCAAVPDHLFESEFFGHRRGCFTGALVDRAGFFEEADGGTLFLDEVGELTTLQQVKLLRVLQEGRIRRVGENAERPVNVRIVSATNQNLEEKLGTAALREDFYYRINAEHIHVPALRDRCEDIVPLIGFCLSSNGGNGNGSVRIEHTALRCLQRYAWPGNVRELFAVLDRAKHIANGEVITIEMLPERIRNGRAVSHVSSARHSTAGQLSAGPRNAEPSDAKQRLEKALDLCGGNKSATARWLGISRGTLYKELRRAGLLGFAHQ